MALFDEAPRERVRCVRTGRRRGPLPADIADQLDLSVGEVYTALAYYHEHAEEMRAVREARADAEVSLAEQALSPPERVS